jgi:hypothetical protein
MTKKLSRIRSRNRRAILGLSLLLLLCQLTWLSTVVSAHDCETDWRRAQD